MIVIFVYVGIALSIGFWGTKKNIGFLFPFIMALLFSPVIGVICVLLSKTKGHNYTDFKQNVTNSQVITAQPKNVQLELIKLKSLLDSRVITLQEYQSLKMELEPKGNSQESELV